MYPENIFKSIIIFTSFMCYKNRELSCITELQFQGNALEIEQRVRPHTTTTTTHTSPEGEKNMKKNWAQIKE